MLRQQPYKTIPETTSTAKQEHRSKAGRNTQKGQSTADAAAQAKRAQANNNESTANQQGRSKRSGQTEYVQQRQASSRRTDQLKNNCPHPLAPPARVEYFPGSTSRIPGGSLQGTYGVASGGGAHANNWVRSTGYPLTPLGIIATGRGGTQFNRQRAHSNIKTS